MPQLPESVTIECDGGNEFDGRLGLRISSIFVILIGSAFGAIFPVMARRIKSFPKWPFFIARFFGSGVIVATAFIHLLAPANEALTNPCLEDFPIASYPFVEAIALMTIFVMFFFEILAMRFNVFGHVDEQGIAEHDHDHNHAHGASDDSNHSGDVEFKAVGVDTRRPSAHQMRGEDHLSHMNKHSDDSSQYLTVAILEFGVIFHSVFVGLTLAVAGEEFTTLYVVIVFHQTFEGLGLGSRLAALDWKSRWAPYALGMGYAISTPIAIAIGLGVRTTYAPGSYTALVTNGIFDSISAGILLYTALVELMAHEFIFSERMRKASISYMLTAFGTMCLGAGLMALLGKWA
jgi:zinc transporter 1/2/3